MAMAALGYGGPQSFKYAHTYLLTYLSSACHAWCCYEQSCGCDRDV